MRKGLGARTGSARAQAPRLSRLLPWVGLIAAIGVSWWMTAKSRRPDELTLAQLDEALLSHVTTDLGVVAAFSGAHSIPDCASQGGPTAVCHAQRATPGQVERTALRRMARAMAGAAAIDRNVGNQLRRRALWVLLSKDSPEARSRTVSLLTLALAQNPSSAARRNDLAAALLVRGTRDRQPLDWVDALELADAASNDLVEAEFNRALALELLKLTRPAHQAWRKVATRQSPLALAHAARRWQQSPAEQHEHRTQEPDLLPLRRSGEQLLGLWGIAFAGGDLRVAAANLDLAESTSQAHLRSSGDRLLADSVAALRRVATSPDRLRTLAEGHAAYERVRGDGLYAECLPDLARAERLLTAGGSPFAGWPRLDQAICAYFRKDFHEGYERLGDAGEIARAHPYPALIGRIDWMVGLMRMLEGRFLESEAALHAAAKSFGSAMEPGHVAYLDALMAKALDNAGEPGRAWQRRVKALAWRHRLGHERMFTVFEGAVESLRGRDRPRAALLFLDEQVETLRAGLGTSADDGDVLALTLLSRSALRRELGLGEGARQDLAATEAIWRVLPSTAEIRERIGYELAVQRGVLERPKADTSLAAVDDAVTFFGAASTEGDWIEILRLLRLRARLERDRGNPLAAERDLRRSIATFERLRLELEGTDERARFLARFRSTYEELVDLLLAEGRSMDALRFVEATSNRWWMEGATADSPREVPRRLDALPKDLLIVRHAHLRDRVLTWSISADGVDLMQRRIPVEAARMVAGMCRDAIRAGHPSAAGTCSSAADLFLPPRVAMLPAGSRLMIVPDDLSQAVPFAALRIGEDQSYLLERLRLSFAPAALTMIRGAARSSATDALIVTDPAFDVAAHPGLRRLSHARQEADRYAALFPQALRLSGLGATRDAVLKELPRVAMAHFSAHGYSDTEAPARSGLLLAATGPRETPDLATLSARDLLNTPLPHLRLAVLAGCNTDPGAVAGSGELSGLATALLAAGAREVVTTGWEIDDALASELFVEFHRCYAGGRAAAECLRLSQLRLLHSQDPDRSAPRSWATYRIYGAEL
jgi:hypothetical protein